MSVLTELRTFTDLMKAVSSFSWQAKSGTDIFLRVLDSGRVPRPEDGCWLYVDVDSCLLELAGLCSHISRARALYFSEGTGCSVDIWTRTLRPSSNRQYTLQNTAVRTAPRDIMSWQLLTYPFLLCSYPIVYIITVSLKTFLIYPTLAIHLRSSLWLPLATANFPATKRLSLSL